MSIYRGNVRFEKTNSTPPFKKFRRKRERKKKRKSGNCCQTKHNRAQRSRADSCKKKAARLADRLFLFFPGPLAIRFVESGVPVRVQLASLPREIRARSKEETRFVDHVKPRTCTESDLLVIVVIVIVIVVVVVSALSESLQAIRTFCYGNFRDEHGRQREREKERERERLFHKGQTPRRLFVFFASRTEPVRSFSFAARRELSGSIHTCNSHRERNRRNRPFDRLNRLSLCVLLIGVLRRG